MMSDERPVDGGDSGSRGAPSSSAGISCVLTPSGEVVGAAGETPTPAFAAAASAVARDAERAARHLGFARWETVVIESARGVLAFAPSGADGDRIAVIGFAPDTPAGAAQRSALRLAAGGTRQ